MCKLSGWIPIKELNLLLNMLNEGVVLSLHLICWHPAFIQFLTLTHTIYKKKTISGICQYGHDSIQFHVWYSMCTGKIWMCHCTSLCFYHSITTANVSIFLFLYYLNFYVQLIHKYYILYIYLHNQFNAVLIFTKISTAISRTKIKKVTNQNQ